MRSPPGFHWRSKPPLGSRLDPSAQLSQGLVGCWIENEGQGLSLYDLSGNGNTGTFPISPTWTASRNGGGLKFNGTNQGVNVSSAYPSLNLSGQFSVSAWINPTSTLNSSQGLLDIVSRVSASGFGYELLFNGNMDSSGQAGITIGIHGGGSFRDWNTPLTFAVGSWSHLVGVWNGAPTTAQLYLNGNAVAGSMHGTGSFNLSPGTIALGIAYWAGSPGRYFPGYIDQPLIYNRALSASGVASLYSDPYQMILPPAVRRMYSFGSRIKSRRTISGRAGTRRVA